MANSDIIAHGLLSDKDLSDIVLRHNITPVLNDVLDAYNHLKSSLHRDIDASLRDRQMEVAKKNVALLTSDIALIIRSLKSQSSLRVTNVAVRLNSIQSFEVVFMIDPKEYSGAALLNTYTLTHELNRKRSEFHCAYHFIDLTPETDLELMIDEEYFVSMHEVQRAKKSPRKAQ